MRWKIAGSNHTTGHPWQVIILARDAADAAAQARNLGQNSAVPLDGSDVPTQQAQRPAWLFELLAFLVFPMMLVALATKTILLAASRLRRMIISD
jgi:hypothetical protein